MTTNTFAALIPLYNKEPYVARAITSVLAQTRPVDEIIIVDDASTDGSTQQVMAFRDPRLRLLKRTDPKQRGLPATRNLGIGSATSRWIALLDADDRWHEDYIEEIEKLLTQASDRTGMLFTGFENIWSDAVVTRDPYSASCEDRRFTHLNFDSFVSTWLRIGDCPVIPSGVVVRRDMLFEAACSKSAAAVVKTRKCGYGYCPSPMHSPRRACAAHIIAQYQARCRILSLPMPAIACAPLWKT